MNAASDGTATTHPDPILGVDDFARVVASPPIPPVESWRPRFVRLEAGDLDRLTSICRAHHIALIDDIDRQLNDLVAVRLPSATAADRQRLIAEMLATHHGSASCGNWVYLPWAGKVVHLLARDDYFEVITDRNRDKLTREEQDLLRSRRIGVAGLSVGGEAAVTVAQEHLCGEIVLADFDRLDLSNLNRLGAGFDELGVNKAIIVARRIARIDPYLKVTVFREGVTEANLDAFLDGLDLLIEECDDLGIKHDVRRRARERGLDIVFAADERGFLSVEPYAGWPELRPFHGRIEQPQASRQAYPTRLAFMQALTEWMGGWDQISERTRRSLEQEHVLGGYPQLASEARFAAGQIGHVARRLLTGERLSPFIGHLDLDRLLPTAAQPNRIARVWRGVTRTGEDGNAYHRHLTDKVLPSLTRIPGYRGGQVLRRPADGGTEFVVMTLWDSMDAIRAFAGEDPECAVVEPEARTVLADFEEVVRHYDVAHSMTFDL